MANANLDFNNPTKETYDFVTKQSGTGLWGSIFNDLAVKMAPKFRPTYKKNAVYDENVGLAKNQAFGTDRAVQEQQKQIEQDATDAMGEAKNYSSSGASLLNTLSQLTSNKNKALRGLAMDNAAINQQKLATLMGANVQSAEEDDKAWNYNVNQPYQLRVNQLVATKKFNDEQRAKQGDMFGSILGSVAGAFLGPIGSAVGGKVGSSLFGGGGGSGSSWGGDIG